MLSQITQSKKPSLRCQIHQKNKLLYMKVKDFESSRSIFYCELCICKDPNFKSSNFISLRQIQEAGSSKNTAVCNWPPFEEDEFDKEMDEIGDNIYQFQDQIETRIKTFFEDFKSEFMNQLNLCKEKMINKSKELSEQNKIIIKQYYSLTKIDTIVNILQDELINREEKEKKCKDVIMEFQVKRQIVSQNLQKIFNDQKQLTQKINMNTPMLLKTQILYLIEQITFFNISSDNYNLQTDSSLLSLHSFEDSPQSETKNMTQNLLADFNFIKSKFKEEYADKMMTTRNQFNQIKFNCQSNQQGYFYSNIVIDGNKKYKFQFTVFNFNPEKSKFFGIGLVRDDQKESNCYKQQLCFILQYSSFFEINNNYSGIKNVVEGDFSRLEQNIELEFTVSISEKILDVVVNNINKATLLDIYESRLNNSSKFRVFVYLQQEIEVVLHTLTVSLKNQN